MSGRVAVVGHRIAFTLVMVTGSVLLLAAVPARAQDAHGAIAFGLITRDQAVAYGFAWDYPTRDEAREAAMNACLDSGGSDCTVLAWFQNSCGALAVDQYGMAQGKGARTLEQAEARALATCEAAGGSGCAVVGSQCVSAGGQPDTWSGSESVLAAPPEARAPRDARDEGLAREEQPAAREAEAEEPDGGRNQVVYFAAAGHKCADWGEDIHNCWQQIQSQPGCYIWQNVNYRSDHVVDWTGGCSGDTAHGTGAYSRTINDEDSSFTAYGAFTHGKQTGHWVIHWGYGYVDEVTYVDGKMHGRWVRREPSGQTTEGAFVDGKQHGRFVTRRPDGSIRRVSNYVHGEYVGED